MPESGKRWVSLISVHTVPRQRQLRMQPDRPGLEVGTAPLPRHPCRAMPYCHPPFCSQHREWGGLAGTRRISVPALPNCPVPHLPADEVRTGGCDGAEGLYPRPCSSRCKAVQTPRTKAVNQALLPLPQSPQHPSAGRGFLGLHRRGEMVKGFAAQGSWWFHPRGMEA